MMNKMNMCELVTGEKLELIIPKNSTSSLVSSNTGNTNEDGSDSDSSVDDLAGEQLLSPKSTRHRFPVEILINFLHSRSPENNNVNAMKFTLSEFETLTANVLKMSGDTELLKCLKGQLWNGLRFDTSAEFPFDPELMRQSLSNLYLKQTSSQNSVSFRNLFGMGYTEGSEQLLSFCPNIVLDYLRRYPDWRTATTITTAATSSSDEDEENDHRRANTAAASPATAGVDRVIRFRGSCMLVDISGFTKFSGLMCSQGVSGLDELRKVTDDFLGYYVQTIYKHGGDVIDFAGDSLLCVFVDEIYNNVNNNNDHNNNNSDNTAYTAGDTAFQQEQPISPITSSESKEDTPNSPSINQCKASNALDCANTLRIGEFR